MDEVIALLAGSPLPATDVNDWAAVLGCAEAGGVLSLVAQALHAREAAGDLQLPSAIKQQLQDAERQLAVAGLRWDAMLRELLQAFATASIDAMPLKGPALAQRLYGTTRLRTCRDLDVLVRAEDTLRVNRTLQSLGYAPAVSDCRQQSSWYRRGLLLEIHYELEDPIFINFDMEAVWRQAHQATFDGLPLWQMDAIDELAYLCVHAARHHFDRVTLVADLVRAFQMVGDDRSPDPQRWSEIPLVASLVCLGYTLARRLCLDLRNLSWTVTPETHVRVEALADTFWIDMLAGKASPENRMAVYGCLCTLRPTRAARLRQRSRLLRLVTLGTVSIDKDTASRWGLAGSFGILLARLARLTSTALSKAWLQVRHRD